MVMGDVHQAPRLHRKLSVALIVMTGICGWSLYQLPPDVGAENVTQTYCYVDGKGYSVGSAKRMASGEVLECVTSVGNGPSHWREIERSRLR